jgi:hypothetical protein
MKTYAITKRPSDKDCYWVEGLGHFNGPRSVVENMVATLKAREVRQ